VTDKTISVFLNLCSLGSNLRQTKYSLGSMTFCLHVQIHPFTALEDTYALLFMDIASCVIILLSEGKKREGVIIESEYNLVFGTA
jgi:hypothetical protein